MATSMIEQVKQALYADPLVPHREGYDPTGLIQKLETILAAPNLPQMRDGSGVDVGPGSRGAEGHPSPFEPPHDPDGLGDPGHSPQSAVMAERFGDA